MGSRSQSLDQPLHYRLRIEPWPVDETPGAGKPTGAPSEAMPSSDRAHFSVTLDGEAVEQPLEIEAALFARCEQLASEEEIASEIIPTDPSTWPPPMLANRLWSRMPTTVKDRLEPTVHGGPHRIELECLGESGKLPWELVGFAHEGKNYQPGMNGAWRIERRIGPTATRKPIAWRPRVLLIAGSLEPLGTASTLSAMPDLHDVDDAIRDATDCTTLEHGTSLEEILKQVASGKFDIVHFLGHSNGTPGREATALLLDRSVVPDSTPEATSTGGGFGALDTLPELDLLRFRQALCTGKVRLAVLQACRTTDRIAHDLLHLPVESDRATDGPLDIVGMTTMLISRWCPDWSRAFYSALAQGSTSVASAMQRAREKDSDTPPWVPRHFTRASREVAVYDEHEDARATYCENLQAECAEFLGDLRQYPGELARVHVSLSILPSLDGRLDRGPASPAAPSSRPLPAGEVSFETLLGLGERRFVITGEPGAGKTTTLRFHAQRLASRGGLDQLAVFVRLPQWVKAYAGSERGPIDHLVQFVRRKHGDKKAFDAALSAAARVGRAVILLDGLDEVGDHRAAVEDLTRALATDDDWSRCPVLVTTRTSQYGRQKLLPGLYQEARLEPLDDERQRRLLRKCFELWCKRNHEDGPQWSAFTAKRFASEYQLWLADSARGRALRELRANPLFLTRIAQRIFQAGPETEAPIGESRYEVYETLLEQVMQRSHQPAEDGDEEEITEEDRTVYAWLALDMVRRHEVELTKSAAANRLKAAAKDGSISLPSGYRTWNRFLDGGHRMFGPDGTGSDAPWRFFHRNFGELLATDALVERLEDLDGNYPALLRDQELPEDPEPEVPKGCFRNLWDLARGRVVLLQQSRQRRPTIDEVVESLRDWFRRDGDPPENAEAARSYLEWQERQRTLSDFWTEPLTLLASRQGAPIAMLTALVAAGQVELALRIVERAEGVGPELVERALFGVGDTRPWFARNEHKQVVYEAIPEGISSLDAGAEISAQLATKLDGASNPDASPDELWFATEALRRLSERGIAAARGAQDQIVSSLKSPPNQWFDTKPWCFAPPPDEVPDSALDEDGRPPPFRLGSPADPAEPGRFDDEGPIPSAQVRGRFCVSRTVVTLDEYRVFAPSHQQLPKDPAMQADDMPAVYVSHHAASMFCRWLEHHAKVRLGEQVSVRLPTEMEWEYAARAGTEAPYWSGSTEEDLARIAHYGQDPQSGRPRRVAMADPNPWGLHDVHGNVAEWCSDWFGPYPEDDSLVDRGGPASGSARVLRGGGFGNGPRDCRSAFRVYSRPGYANGFLGFRVVLAAPGLGPSIFDL